MEQANQYIKVGMAFIDAISRLDENKPEYVSQIFDILNCIHPDYGYHMGIYIEEPSDYEAATHACDQSWFHCYQGIEEPIMRQPYNPTKWRDGNNDNMLYLRFTFEMFQHMNIEKSTMGAWQVYLLCVSKTLLPFSGGLYYTKRQLILTQEQAHNIRPFWRWKSIPELENLSEDVSPNIVIKDNQATVSCCYWNDWEGLIREHVTISFTGNGKVEIGNFLHDTIIKYCCRIKF